MLYVIKRDPFIGNMHQIAYSVFKKFLGVTPLDPTLCCDPRGGGGQSKILMLSTSARQLSFVNTDG